jgi:hypothetical protein
MLDYVDNVDSEDGPLLIADARAARLWRGSDGNGSDYERAYKPLLSGAPGTTIPIDSHQAVIWELGGAGTADVFYEKRVQIRIVRAWVDNKDIIDVLADAPLNKNHTNLGAIEVSSGVLAILWAPENGQCIESLRVSQSSRPSGEMATDSAGLLLKVPKGQYTCLHDEVEKGGEAARRCHIILMP